LHELKLDLLRVDVDLLQQFDHRPLASDRTQEDVLLEGSDSGGSLRAASYFSGHTTLISSQGLNRLPISSEPLRSRAANFGRNAKLKV
jgi:hypothetical protein